jgi:adenylate cyclase
MSLTRRDRRDWRIFYWVSLGSAAISAYFGYAIAPADDPPLHGAFHGVVASLIIATPILVFELRSARAGFLRRLRRLPLAVYFILKVLFYFIVIVGGFALMRYLTTDTAPFEFDATFRSSIAFAIAMSVAANLVFDMGGLLGFGTLKSLLTGRYVQPRQEDRAFVLIDMRDSTGLAERLGPIRFHELLNAFFRDVTDAALECEGEIHKYVGDEAILTWSGGEALASGDCLECPFVARDIILANRQRYETQFGTVPSFRAAIHCGEIVAGEIGDVRREIAYVGDTLNVAARLLDAAKSLGKEVLVSAALLDRVTLPPDLRADPLSTLTLRGRSASLEIAALERR